MSIALVTGSSGLIGSETARFLHAQGLEVVGIDNNMREYFFGKTASTDSCCEQLKKDLIKFSHYNIDIRNLEELRKVFERYSNQISLIVHAAAQPSHDWAAREPFTDFSVNANGTLNLLELYRIHAHDAVFIFTSTNKVYGDTPNQLPIIETPMRWSLDSSHPSAQFGIDETLSIDQSKHSLFGASKLAADILVQEYGRYFGLKTGIFRGGCLTGPAHAGAELHGFLAYLVKCLVQGDPYTIFGYRGKQVRDNIHSHDLVSAFWHYFKNPKNGEVYNMGGGIHSNCSILEAIQLAEQISGKKLQYTITDQVRSGDHIWWISDVRKFQNHYPAWKYHYDLPMILKEMIEVTQEASHGKSRHS